MGGGSRCIAEAIVIAKAVGLGFGFGVVAFYEPTRVQEGKISGSGLSRLAIVICVFLEID